MISSIRSSARIVFRKLLPRLAYPVVHMPLRGARFVLGALAGEGGGASVYFNVIETEHCRFRLFFCAGGSRWQEVIASALSFRGGVSTASRPV